MLDAHVRFEVDRLTGAGLQETARAEVAALFVDWGFTSLPVVTRDGEYRGVIFQIHLIRGGDATVPAEALMTTATVSTAGMHASAAPMSSGAPGASIRFSRLPWWSQ